jgi:hypothetical protein
MNLHSDEIGLMTYRPEAMKVWWAALLGATVEALDARTAVIETPSLRVVIEQSEIAMDASPEVAGVVSLTLSAPTAVAALDTTDRLAAVGCTHHRATDDRSGVRLWYRDPNGSDIAIRLPLDAAAGNRLGQEIDPDEIIARLQLASDRSHVSENHR